MTTTAETCRMNLERALPLTVGLCLLAACPSSDDENPTTGAATDSQTGPGSTAATTDASTEPQSTEATASTSTGTSADTEPGTESGTSDTDAPTGTDPGTDGTTGEPGPFQWTPAGGPCAGSGTNTLWFDDRNTGFIGCGENANGEGLFTTVDGGETWEDNVRFNEVRIMDIRRGPDGVLYGAGIHQLDGYPVWAFDESGATIDATGLYTGSGTVGQVSQAQNVAVTSDGRALIDSLTGTSAAYLAASGDWEEVDSLSEDLLGDPDALSYQVRRIRAYEDAFYAVGSRINDPGRVHLPSQLPDATFHFATVELQPETRDGELQDIHVWDATHILVAGHDQSTRFPLIYRLDGGDAYDSASWEQIELLDSGLEYQGRVNALSVVGDTVVAAGAKFPSGGFVVISADQGQTWEDISPQTGALSAVWMFETGEIVAAGGSGELWIFAE